MTHAALRTASHPAHGIAGVRRRAGLLMLALWLLVLPAWAAPTAVGASESGAVHAGTRPPRPVPSAPPAASRATPPVTAPAASPDRPEAGRDASPAPRIGMVTMLPGEIFWERFGHDAIAVVDPVTGAATSYNFGFFDPGEPDFLSRFVRGQMRYMLAALPLEQDLSSYRDSGRGVSIQWLDLDPAQARELAAALADNARPEHAHYRYDYFLDNCSTRVRDALDRVLDGGLHAQLEGRSHGSTFRSEALRLASPAPWMWLGFDLALGPDADLPQPLWAESFVPMRLASALREVKNTHGNPLVLSEHTLLPHRLAPEPAEAPQQWWPWTLAGLALGIGAAWLGRRRPRALAGLALPFWLLAGTLGAVLLLAWGFTEHRVIWANRNLLLLHPLCWMLLPGGWAVLRGRRPGPWFNRMLIACVGLAVLAAFVHWLPMWPQRNAHWIGLLLPLHAGIWLGLRRTSRA